MEWVYNKLVKDDTDIPGQFACLYYKLEKRKFAENLKTSGMPDDDVVNKLREFQKSVADNPNTLITYKTGGDGALQAYLSEMQEDTLDTARKEFRKENQKIGEAIHDLNKLVGQKRSIPQRLLSWLLIGVRAWLVTALIGIVLFLIALMLVSDGTQKNVLDEALDGIIKYIECQKSNAPPECQE
ncbi:MAG: hypothetical protein K9G33_07835 [Sneathiella sp.]|nr:hypothetical protein [Sneathiella sp.]